MAAKNFLIIGGGISGLALAQGLKQSSIPFHVYESDPSPLFRPQGYRFRVNPDGAAALQSLLSADLFARFEKVCAEDPSLGAKLNALNGEEMYSSYTGKSEKAYTADRTVTRNLLMRGLEDDISYGKRLSRYEESEQGVTAFFEDGSSAAGTFLVGADGLKSVVCKQYLPKHITLDTDCRCVYGKTLITDELLEQLSSVLKKGMSVLFDESRDKPLIVLLEAIRFQDNDLRSELPEDYVYWVLGASREYFDTPDNELLHLSGLGAADLTLKLAEKWLPSFKVLFEMQEKKMTSALRISMASPEMPAWESSGKIALMGDAAHVMPPTGGVGANTALQDAAALCKVLKGDVGQASVAGYDEEMRKRARRAIMGSAQGGKHLLGMKDWEKMEAFET